MRTSRIVSRWTQVWRVLISLKLTIVCLATLMVLVVACTLAQVHLGTYLAVKTYIRSLFLYGSLPGVGWEIPIFPGGATVGIILLINLFASHFDRIQLTWEKMGLWLAHFGLILLLLGEFVTGLYSKEMNLAFEVGTTKNYAESIRDTELAVLDTTDSQFDQVTSIPESVFSRRRRIQHPSLPFSILIKRYYPNASLEMRPGDAPPSLATASHPSGTSNALHPSGVSRVPDLWAGVPDLRAGAGIGTGIAVHEEPVVTRDDQQNQVTVFAEFLEGERSLGTWLLSTALGAPQGFSLGGRNFKLAIRLARHYLPFSLTLKKFSHDRYAGTDIPKNFSSLVRLQDPDRSEDRDVLISMNNPLRYGGKTFYQASFGKEDTLSILQVVENPGWLLPYVSCTLVGLGLLVHFLRRMMSARTKPALA